jgi:hypothetical protein
MKKQCESVAFFVGKIPGREVYAEEGGRSEAEAADAITLNDQQVYQRVGKAAYKSKIIQRTAF